MKAMLIFFEEEESQIQFGEMTKIRGRVSLSIFLKHTLH
jgi:hypothetical protein